MKIGVETDWKRIGFRGPSWRWLGEEELWMGEQITIWLRVVRLAHAAVDPARASERQLGPPNEKW